MKRASCLAACIGVLLSSPLLAAPTEDSCTLLAAVGGNDPEAVTEALNGIASRWTEEGRERAIDQMTAIASGNVFAGGNVYRTLVLGADLEEHLVVLRLRTGEVAGMLLRYEWTSDGLRLVALEAKRQVTELIGTRALTDPDPVPCP